MTRVDRGPWTVPNLLSVLRILGVPLFLWAILTHRDGIAVATLVLSGVTDYLDGQIARRYGLVTRLGQLLDPIADRLYIAATMVGLAAVDVIPWWLLVLLVARDAFILSMYPTVRRHRLPIPPVDFIGKSATFNLLGGFPLLLLGDGPGTGAEIARSFGWAFAIWGTCMYWWAGVLYAVQVRTLLREVPRPRRAARAT